MLILRQKSFSFKQEMNKLLQGEKLQGISQFMLELDTLKTHLGFEEGQISSAVEPSSFAQEDKIEQYIQILFNLTLYFDIPTNLPGVFEFSWQGNASSRFFTGPRRSQNKSSAL